MDIKSQLHDIEPNAYHKNIDHTTPSRNELRISDDSVI